LNANNFINLSFESNLSPEATVADKVNNIHKLRKDLETVVANYFLINNSALHKFISGVSIPCKSTQYIRWRLSHDEN